MTINPLRREHYCSAPQGVFTSHLNRMRVRCDIQYCRICNY